LLLSIAGPMARCGRSIAAEQDEMLRIIAYLRTLDK